MVKTPKTGLRRPFLAVIWRVTVTIPPVASEIERGEIVQLSTDGADVSSPNAIEAKDPELTRTRRTNSALPLWFITQAYSPTLQNVGHREAKGG